MTLTLSQILGESALKAAGLLVCAAVVVLILRRAPARIRAVVWSMALAGVILFPAATKLMPRWDVPLPHSVATKLSAFRPEVAPQLLEPELFGHPSQSLVHRESSRVVGPKIGEVANQPIAAASPSRISLAGLMLATWLCGLTAVLLWQAVGWLRVWTLVRRGQPLREARWGDLLERVARRVGVRRPIQVIVSSEISAPATWGWRCPVVLLPKRSENWIRERREVVLMHELVHVARFDWPLRMLARLAAAIYWFNPLSWWALHRLHTEQELACDEEVIALGTRASTYASHLLDIARAVIPQPMFGVAALGMARKSRVEGRIMAIL
ncbi:MAG: M56 family metallopeptidase, partial [bacterium]|nr:M56 family metallopeptidase [bacterium]